MSFEIIDNTFQVIVLAAMALLAFILAFRRSSRSCLILAFGYASFMMGTLYYLLHLIILGHGALRLSASAFRQEVEQVEGQIADILAANNRRQKTGNVRSALERAQRQTEEEKP